MKRQIQAALLSIALLSGINASASAQYSPGAAIYVEGPVQSYQGFQQMPARYPNGYTDSRAQQMVQQHQTIQPQYAVQPGANQVYPTSPSVMPGAGWSQHQTMPHTDMRYRGPNNSGFTPNQGLNPYQPIQGGSMNGRSGSQHQLPSVHEIRQRFQPPQPQSKNLLHYNERYDLLHETYNDGYGGSASGRVGLVAEGNLDLLADPNFAGVRGGVRGGLEAQGHVQQQYDINGMPVRQYASGNAFLGTEAQAQAGLGRDGLGAQAGAFSGARAQLTNGLDLGMVDASQTLEVQAGLGAEASGNIGLRDGRFRVNGELGAALGVGGKLGVDAEVDLGETGRFVERTGNGAIRTGGNVARDVGRWGNQAGRDINRTTNSVKRSANKVANDAKRSVDKVGGGIKKLGKSIFGK